MKNINIYRCLVILALSFTVVSCNDFLDHEPDNRAELETPKQIKDLLVSAYSYGNYGTIAEMSSDNIIDNNSPDATGIYYNLPSVGRHYDEMYAWENIVSSDTQDSPSSVWGGCYYAIAAANHILEAIEKLENKGRGDEVSAHKGEALLIRAYHHFILVNMFAQAYKNDELSAKDMGIPYVTEVERVVSVDYERLSVAEVYKKIEEDLRDGIDLINDNLHKVPKYHFNKKAANAFAARFYLYKGDYDKVIQYATNVLGNNPSSYLRNWNQEYPTATSFAYGWINTLSQNNLMLLATYSSLWRINVNSRYTCNREAADATFMGSGPTWSRYNFNPIYSGRLYVSSAGQEFGLYFLKLFEFFEYTDKIAGIGYTHIVRTEFTGDETLLCRAEAYIHLKMFDEAVADLKAFDDSRKRNGFTLYTDLTKEKIVEFYTNSNNRIYTNEYNYEKMHPGFTITAEQKPYIDCVLHFRRLETMFDGLRWFDIKRYGIEITHKVGRYRVETLTWDDPRRAIQVPQEVISAGLEPNGRADKNQTIFPFNGTYIQSTTPCVVVD